MAQHGKKYQDAAKKIEEDRLYLPEEAISLLREVAFANFDETVEIHARLGIDPRQADQTVRTNTLLPHGTGKVVRVLVFASGDAERVALEAGADYAGSDELIQRIQGDWLEFDASVAMADQMGKVGGLGRILGRRGLMPNPRSGTVVRNPEDLPGVIRELKGGRIEFRNDRTGIVHTVVGRKNFTDDQLRDNLFAVVDAINRAKPSGAKGVYCRTLTLTTTMSPGIPLDVTATMASASAAAA
ncbi:MAG TPA: 50S ribosomal protein L1 [Thermomicrobiales bacterium]|nr:50S ribosomal protein L1 [Thermomicrobiales bacterium]